MVDRESVDEFLELEFEERGLKIPVDISKDALVEVFCEHLEESYHEWLGNNFREFFNDGNPDWNWIREHIEANEQ